MQILDITFNVDAAMQKIIDQLGKLAPTVWEGAKQRVLADIAVDKSLLWAFGVAVLIILLVAALSSAWEVSQGDEGLGYFLAGVLVFFAVISGLAAYGNFGVDLIQKSSAPTYYAVQYAKQSVTP